MRFYNESNLIGHSASTDQQGSQWLFKSPREVLAKGRGARPRLCSQRRRAPASLRPEEPPRRLLATSSADSPRLSALAPV